MTPAFAYLRNVGIVLFAVVCFSSMAISLVQELWAVSLHDWIMTGVFIGVFACGYSFGRAQ
jgi:hypothetical protein